MPKDNQVLVRVNDPTNRAIEDFAEDRDYNKAEAVREIAKSRLTSEGYLNQELYGNPDAVTDGGEVKEQLEAVEEKIDNRRQFRQLMDMTVIIAMAWIGIQLSVGGLGPTLSLATGIPLIVSLIYTLHKWRVHR